MPYFLFLNYEITGLQYLKIEIGVFVSFVRFFFLTPLHVQKF